MHIYIFLEAFDYIIMINYFKFIIKITMTIKILKHGSFVSANTLSNVIGQPDQKFF